MKIIRAFPLPLILAALSASTWPAFPQAPSPELKPPAIPGLPAGFKMPPRTPNDTLVSPQVAPDGRITFRLYAPEAKSVTLRGEFLDFFQPPLALVKDELGVWSATTEPVLNGAYRYNFIVDGATVLDSRNPETSATATSAQSLVDVSTTADDIQAARAGVPHGAISTVYYDSPVAGGPRRLHLYLPPGYDKGKNYPVLYLIHGGGDADESWPTVGRAGFILDNLIAAGKARPMVLVFPAGGVKGGQPMVADPDKDPFTAELMTVIIPYIEGNYHVSAQPEDRALAGLSMGGIQALNIGLTHTQQFRYVGVFSSGWFPPDLKAFDDKYGATLGQETGRLKLLWVAYGAADIAKPQALKVLKMFDGHGVKYTAEETPGGHTWANWRLYLSQFAPLLFR